MKFRVSDVAEKQRTFISGVGHTLGFSKTQIAIFLTAGMLALRALFCLACVFWVFIAFLCPG